MLIGSIVRSNSHISYLCRVFGKLDTEETPRPEDYSFGTFVSLAPQEGSPLRLVGVIRDTILINPDYGALGPRLSSDDDLAVFSPDYLDEKGVLVDVLIIGWLADERAYHSVPPLAALVGNRVETMDDAEVERFHRDSRGHLLIGYFPQLMVGNDPTLASLLLGILDRLEPFFPEQKRVIGVLRTNVAWKARVEAAG